MDIVTYKTSDSSHTLTARAGLVAVAELIKRLGLPSMIDRRLPRRDSNRAYPASIIFNTLMLMLHDGARCLAEVRLLQQESALMNLLGMSRLPGARTLGNTVADRPDGLFDLTSSTDIEFQRPLTRMTNDLRGTRIQPVAHRCGAASLPFHRQDHTHAATVPKMPCDWIYASRVFPSVIGRKTAMANTLLTLNLIAFAFHGTCDQLCALWYKARQNCSRRKRFFYTIDVLTEWWYFDNWYDLLIQIAYPRHVPSPRRFRHLKGQITLKKI